MAKKQLNAGPKFEDNLEEINRLIKIQVSKWSLAGLPHLDKDDIANIILNHIYKKFHLYDQTRPIGNWLTSVIQSQMKNCYRNFYYKFCPPCLQCPSYLGKNNSGDGECKIFGTCNKSCGLFNEWLQNKQSAYNVNLAVTLEDHSVEVNSKPFDELDFDAQIENLKFKLADVLSDVDFQIFQMFYLDNKSDLEIIKELKFSSKTEGLRRLKILKFSIVGIVKNLLSEED